MTQICVASDGPPRQNAIFVPSGDHAGAESLAPDVSGVIPLPSAFITQIRSSLENAIRLPSGDHAGSSLSPEVDVNAACELPSAFINHNCVVSDAPPREKTI